MKKLKIKFPKIRFKPTWEWGWTREGFIYRKWNWVIISPQGSSSFWKLRLVGSGAGKPLDEGEGDYYSKEEAMKNGNKNIRADHKKK